MASSTTPGAYLDEAHRKIRDRLDDIEARRYGTAYDHMMRVHAILSIWEAIGISTRQAPKAVRVRRVGGHLTVTPGEVSEWCGIKYSSFQQYKSAYEKAKEVYHQLVRRQTQGQGQLNVLMEECLGLLRLIFSTAMPDLIPPNVQAPSMEYTLIGMKWQAFRKKIGSSVISYIHI